MSLTLKTLIAFAIALFSQGTWFAHAAYNSTKPTRIWVAVEDDDDFDDDGITNDEDEDDDNDGVSDEEDQDDDNDGISDDEDDDDDNDGIPDEQDNADEDGGQEQGQG